MSTPTASGDTLTTAGASRYTGIAESTLKQWRGKGGGPAFIAMGRAIRYQKADLDAYMMARRCRSTVEARARRQAERHGAT